MGLGEYKNEKRVSETSNFTCVAIKQSRND